MTTFYILVFLSMLTHFVSKMYDAVSTHKDTFSIIVWIINPRNYLYIILSTLFSVMLAMSVKINFETIISLQVIDFKVAYLIAIVFGWMPSSIFHAILKKVIKTK